MEITPPECQNRFRECCWTEWCMSLNFADSEEGTLTDRRGSGREEGCKDGSQNPGPYERLT